VASRPRPESSAAPSTPGKLDLFSAFDERLVHLRPYWSLQGKWSEGTGEILLGWEAAERAKKKPGDRIHFESIDHEFRVAEILERTATQDDGLYYVSLPALQEIFHKPGQLTAVAVAVPSTGSLDSLYLVTSRSDPAARARFASAEASS